MKQKELHERYKKLKQSDRMEYLAIDSVYEKRSATHQLVISLLFGFKIFLLAIIDLILFTLEPIPVSNIFKMVVETSVGEFSFMILFIVVLIIMEIGTFLLELLNNKNRNKRLNEFLTERKV